MPNRVTPPIGPFNTGVPTRQQPGGRSFAQVYEQARRASTNDNATQKPSEADLQDAQNNRKYIENLHERVDTVRGELLVRVIQSGALPETETVKLSTDINRLSKRLNQLRDKLQSEETRLSGKLIDIDV